ncbi:hypothetical protein [Burkholderia sp. Se-20378]|uniref:hypothetical protein n=1 Tax=Burkholderia sp. Se-20378 TaxID=2703899 RepID=UPI00197EEA4B|nr:hypothetical protein [Burkholderia sp. Se-20378]MBN3774182.1 hypothetical protein [Burkholderia sp. Se-20378]
MLNHSGGLNRFQLSVNELDLRRRLMADIPDFSDCGIGESELTIENEDGRIARP